MKFVQAFLAFFLVLGFILKPTQANDFCDKLANGTLTIKAMGPAGNSFLIVTETKEFLKLPLIALSPTELTILNKIEPQSLNDSKFSFTDSSLWLLDSESSLILHKGDGTFYQIHFKGDGAFYKTVPFEGSASQLPTAREYTLLPNQTDNSTHFFKFNRLEQGFGSVTINTRRLLFNNLTHRIQISETVHQLGVLPVFGPPTAAFIHEGAIFLVTAEFVLRYRYSGTSQLEMKRMNRSDFIKCTPRPPPLTDYSWLGIILGIIVLVTIAFAIGLWLTRKPDTSSVTH